MPTIKHEKVVPYSPAQMFMLVNQAEDYPHFVPYCTSATILNQQLEERHVRLEFSKGALHKSFTTCNRLQQNKMIHIRLVDGPFEHLEGFWQFASIRTGCHISLDMEFEFSNKWLATLFGPVFNTVANRLVDVFCERAEHIYVV